MRVVSLAAQVDYSTRYYTLPPKKQLAHAYTGVDKAQSELGLTGKGIKIGFLDAGIDYTHPAFGGCFGPGCRVQYGYDFVGDNYNGYNTPQPDDDPIEACSVHGTHVTGIAVGNHGEFKGVAPNATIGAYRILGCSLKTATNVIL
ncbi:peptidase S8/S53 domain-containing protein, partial [Dimargaris cristalligena]